MHVSLAELERFVTAVLQAVDVPEEDARTVGNCLATANARGIDSHGVVRIAHYVRRLRRGSINARPNITIERRAPSVVAVDGDDGLGHVVAARAAAAGREVAREQGTASVAVRNSSHFGPASYFLLPAAREGIGGMCMTNTDAIVVPHGAARRFTGTNPVAFGFPAPGAPYMLDISTSTIAYGKIALAQVEEKPIPEEWALDETGRPTTNARAVAGMHPMAGHKGSGIGLTVDVFCALLTGMPFGPHINRMYFELDEPRKLGHFMTFWDVAAFVPLSGFVSRMGEMIDELHGLPLFEGFTRIYYPGEIEGEREDERTNHGVPLEQGLYDELRELARECGVAPPQPMDPQEDEA
jgi:ureidoglycolate dehydrogenase (NAD+)